MKTLTPIRGQAVSLAIGQPVRRDGFACRDEGQRAKPLGSRMMEVNALRELQSAGGEELSALMPSLLDKAFKGEL